ncbi:MAG: hypothetical protein M1820_010865 [Bogoriella megaspora]|nr:MAG: hypothetical protein M1820_010865 [Bogoriella megaspora]
MEYQTNKYKRKLRDEHELVSSCYLIEKTARFLEFAFISRLSCSLSFAFEAVDSLIQQKCKLEELEASNLLADSPPEPLHLDNTTGGSGALKRVSMWYEECMLEHAKCRMARSRNTRAPTRLLEIDAPSPGFIRLVNTTNQVRYGTLSHCWGSSQPFILESSTQDQLFLGIKIRELSQTFQHAVTVARKLQLSFLWIDSLCIAQDSLNDWMREASLMGDVYSGSNLNIAATAASCGEDGCFRERDLSRFRLRYAKLSLQGTERQWYRVSDQTFSDWDNWKQGPLLRRGWAYQERLLAPAVVHYGTEQVWWECHELIANEIYPNGVPPTISGSLKGQRQRAANLLQIPKKAEPQELLDVWMQICEAYSTMALTKSSDKLVAISGLAKRINHIHDKLIRPAQYTAPSWSWASVSGQVRWEKIDSASLAIAKVLEVKVRPVGNDDTGQVKHGHVRLRGYLGTVILGENDIGSDFSTPYLLINGQMLMRDSCLLAYFDDRCQEVTDKIHCMPITHSKVDRGSTFEALLLQPTNACKGEFRRCGLLTGGPRLSDHRDEWFGDVLPFFSEPDRRPDSWLEYEDFDGKDQYTITII